MENNIIKLEEEFLATISVPWSGNTVIMNLGFESALDHFPIDGDNETRKVHELLTYIRDNYKNVSLEEIKTKGKNIIAKLKFSSKGELDRLCADSTIKVRALMPIVSMPWESENVNISMDFESAWNYFTIRGGSELWKVHALIKHLTENYENVKLKRMERRGIKLFTTLSFSSKEEFDYFCDEHRN